MNCDQRVINNVSHEISKRKANPNEYDGVIIYNTTRDQFKMRAHSFTCTISSHRLDRICPPPLDHVSSLQPPIPIMTDAVKISTIEFKTQSSAPISQPCRYPVVPIKAMKSSITELLNTQPPDLPSQPLMLSALTHFNGRQPNNSHISQPYQYLAVPVMTNTLNNSIYELFNGRSPYPLSHPLQPSSLTHFRGQQPNNAHTSVPYQYHAASMMTVNNSTTELLKNQPSESLLHFSLDHFNSHHRNMLNDSPIITNTMNTQQTYPPPQPSLAHVTNNEPNVWKDVPIIIITKTMNNTTTELLNVQPFSPSSQSLLQLLPSPLSTPPSPQEQESVETLVDSFMQQFENKVKEDYLNQELLYGKWSPFHHIITTSDEYQQQENIPPLVPGTLSSGSLTRPNSPNDLGLENIQPPIPTNLPNFPNNIESDNIPPPISTTSPSRSLAWPNSPIDLGSENIPFSVSASSPSQSLYWRWPDSLNGSFSPSLLLSPIQPPKNVTSLVSATSPSRIIDYPNSPNEPSSPIMMFSSTFVSSPTTGLMKNIL